jgi:hypothetical protein
MAATYLDRLAAIADRLVSRPGDYMASERGMKRVGLANSMKLGKLYNRIRHRGRWNLHRNTYQNEFSALLKQNGGEGSVTPRVRLHDGWAIDTSQSLPHLDRLLEEGAEIIRQRAGRTFGDIQYPFLRYLNFPADLQTYPSLLDFITSSEMLATAGEYIGTIPVLSKCLPPGVRFMESNAALDPDNHLPPRQSQLYHIDYYDSPQVYVLVLIEDVTLECGPWTFLPASVTERVAKRLGYRGRGWPYRVLDEQIYPHVDKSEEIVFAYPRGTVLFIDSSRCFHFGSRNCVKPRYMMAYALQSPCRCDFAYARLPIQKYPIAPGASRLRKMVLE